MAEVTYRMGEYDAETGQVSVTFYCGEHRHKRPVNAMLRSDRSYDKEATREIVKAVARGVAVKFDLGVLPAKREVEYEA